VRLTDKIAVITGAASGIGRATSLRFAAEGARVVCMDSDLVRLEDTRLELARMGGRVPLCVSVDIADGSEVRSAFEHVLRELGEVHVLLNVAGRNFVGDIASLDERAWDACLAVNLRSVFLTAKAVWPHFVRQNTGVILNTASVMGRAGSPQSVAYSTAKAGIINLTRCLAVDGAPHGIRANVICPGVVDTPVMTEVFDRHADPRAAQTQMARQIPLNRMADADEVAAAFAYLASDDAAYVTGAELVIDGGLSSLLPLRG
jgi:NAD(P)-dependent dehydrogenase (short-subunit alcohol dehydrogenase family)